MKIVYIDIEKNNSHVFDNKRRIKDKYFEVDPFFELEYLKDKDLPSYTLDDCVLVRVTDIFPFNHEIHTPFYDKAYELGGSIYFHDVIVDKLRKMYGYKTFYTGLPASKPAFRSGRGGKAGYAFSSLTCL